MADSRKSLLSKNVISNVLTHGVNLLLVFAVIRVVISSVGRSHYALFVLATTFMGSFQLLNAGLPGALLKFIPEYRAKNDQGGLNKLISSALAFYLAVGGVACSLLLLLALFGPRLFDIALEDVATSRRVFLLSASVTLITWPIMLGEQILKGFQEYHRFNIARVLQMLILNGLYIAIAFLHWPVESLLLAFGFSQLILGAILYVVIRSLFPGLSVRLAHCDWNSLKKLFGFGLWILVYDFAIIFIYQFDRFIVGIFLPIAAVTIYQVQIIPLLAIRQTNYLLLQASFPAVAAAEASGDRRFINALLSRGTRINMVVMVGIVFTAMAVCRPAIHVWMGADFAEHAIVCRVILIHFAVALMFSLVCHVLMGKGIVKPLSLLYLGISLLNVFLSIVLIGPFGLVGVAWATTLSHIALVVFAQPCLLRPLGLSLRTFFYQGPLRIYCVSGALALLVYFGTRILGADPKFFWTVLYITGGTLFVLIGTLFFGIGRDEQEGLRSFLISGVHEFRR